ADQARAVEVGKLVLDVAPTRRFPRSHAHMFSSVSSFLAASSIASTRPRSAGANGGKKSTCIRQRWMPSKIPSESSAAFFVDHFQKVFCCDKKPYLSTT
ncbi:MAG: hypothetical protein Q8O81_02400, partial [Giesbergeria sp.]|nr:hypothetical protein [Giesbergeria sp.]